MGIGCAARRKFPLNFSVLRVEDSNKLMNRTVSSLALALLACAAAPAATISTTLTGNATASIGAPGITASGTAALPTLGTGRSTATLSLTPATTGDHTPPLTSTL